MQLEHLAANKHSKRPNLQCLSDCLDCLNGLLIALNKEKAIALYGLSLGTVKVR